MTTDNGQICASSTVILPTAANSINPEKPGVTLASSHPTTATTQASRHRYGILLRLSREWLWLLLVLVAALSEEPSMASLLASHADVEADRALPGG